MNAPRVAAAAAVAAFCRLLLFALARDFVMATICVSNAKTQPNCCLLRESIFGAPGHAPVQAQLPPQLPDSSTVELRLCDIFI